MGGKVNKYFPPRIDSNYMQNGVIYSRLIHPPQNKSLFSFGPRGTRKTTWVQSTFPNSVYIDLLEAELFNDLIANPQRLSNFIPPGFKDWVICHRVKLQLIANG